MRTIQAPDPRLPFEDAAELARLRCDTFDRMGVESGIAVLYGIGVSEGMRDGMLAALGFAERATAASPVGGCAIPMVFTPEGLAGQRFRGELRLSQEARVHLDDFPAPDDPICVTSAGYAAGWYSALLERDILVRETECRACGDASCRFEARSLDDWLAVGDSFVEHLLAFVNPGAIREETQRRVLGTGHPIEPTEPGPSAEMMGGFDAMSPAVHVWGPVMVLPYSGTEDCLVALEVVREDVGPHQIRVVVLDATGAHIDPVEALGIARLLDALEAQSLEAVLVGLGASGSALFDRQRGLNQPVIAKGISEAITLGFQLAHRAGDAKPLGPP